MMAFNSLEDTLSRQYESVVRVPSEYPFETISRLCIFDVDVPDRPEERGELQDASRIGHPRVLSLQLEFYHLHPCLLRVMLQLQRLYNALSNRVPLPHSYSVFSGKFTGLTSRQPPLVKARQYSRITGPLRPRSRNIPRYIDTFKQSNIFQQGQRHSRIPELTKPYTRNYVTDSNVAPTSFSDPSRPDLYYHLVHLESTTSTQPVFALSFLPTPPSSADSSTVIGWLPASTLQGDDEAGLNDFKQNRELMIISYASFIDHSTPSQIRNYLTRSYSGRTRRRRR